MLQALAPAHAASVPVNVRVSIRAATRAGYPLSLAQQQVGCAVQQIRAHIVLLAELARAARLLAPGRHPRLLRLRRECAQRGRRAAVRRR
jgi:hypothetical protein